MNKSINFSISLDTVETLGNVSISSNAHMISPNEQTTESANKLTQNVQSEKNLQTQHLKLHVFNKHDSFRKQANGIKRYYGIVLYKSLLKPNFLLGPTYCKKK